MAAALSWNYCGFLARIERVARGSDDVSAVMPRRGLDPGIVARAKNTSLTGASPAMMRNKWLDMIQTSSQRVDLPCGGGWFRTRTCY
jgi:hypothetical protein